MATYKITSRKTGKSRTGLTTKEVLVLTKLSPLGLAKALVDGHDRFIISEEKKAPQEPDGAAAVLPFWRRKPVMSVFAVLTVAVVLPIGASAINYARMSPEVQAAYDEKFATTEDVAQQQTTTSATTDCRGKDDTFVLTAAQLEMKKHLKSPGTARFPARADNIADAGQCEFIVTSYVDSQNSFGGVVRTDYIAHVKIIGESRVDVEILAAEQR